jgi:hypothetical protein
MSKRFLKFLAAVVAALLCVNVALSAEAEKDKTQGLKKTTTNDDYTWFTINNLFNWYGNNGNSSYNIATANSGLEFPGGTSLTACFEDGILWGGFHKGRAEPKVGGDAYRYGLQAGRILTPGGPTEADTVTADDPTLPVYRIYRVRADVSPTTPYANVQASLEAEAVKINRYANATGQSLFADYQTDWNEWPAKTAANPNGLAPFKDVNGNGVYDPTVDIPGVAGADQTIYYVANDGSASRTTKLYFSPPIGMEVHKTIWGYNLPGALGNTIFSSTLLINKSGAPLDSAFLVQWSDIDLGDAGDDYAACDIPRSLGYVYNGKNVDATYGSEVPATGYTFFQGPLVPAAATDSAVFRLEYRHGYKNLGMTTFDFFINGSAIYTDPPQGVAGGDVQWYRLMNARITTTDNTFDDPTTGQPTNFTLSGDPLKGTGWLDGTYGLVPGDRRICLVTGPFTFANADTQELVVGQLVGLGGDRISSIGVLRWYSDLAQSAYNTLFNISRPPPAPKVSAVAVDGGVTLSWSDSVGSTPIENWVSNGYAFEGYTVYQFPTAAPDITAGIRLANYDIVNSVTVIFDDQYDASTGYIISKPVHFGSDNGIRRYYHTKQDAVSKGTFKNGSSYYFGVSSYSFNPNPTAKPASLESTPNLLTLVPQSPVPGARYQTPGDTVNSIQTVLGSGSVSDGLAFGLVVDPPKLTGHTYRVNFRDVAGTTVWDLTDVTTGAVKISGNTNLTGDENYPIVDGLVIKVTGPAAPGMKDWTIPSGTRRWTWAGVGSGGNWGSEGFSGAIGNAYDQWFSGSTLGYGDLRNVLIKLAETTADGVINASDPNVSYGYRYLRGATSAPARPEFAPFIVNATGGYAYQDYNPKCPLAAFNVETTPPTRLMVGWLENNATGGLVDGEYWPGDYNVTDNIAGTGPREWLFIFGVPYSTTPDPSLQVDILNTTLPIMWFCTFNRRGVVPYSAGDEFLITSNHINTPDNVFTLTPPAAISGDLALSTADVDRVNVFPNPYIGFNPQEANKYQRFVTFTHLPVKATLRVFNLAGVLVRTIQKDDPTQFRQWDLRNEDGFPVAAGMYIVHIDMPAEGKTKILKLGVIPEQQFIDKW